MSMVILGCHYDGHDISQGAVDPASGMVLVTEAARVLRLYAHEQLKRTVRFIGFGTEEIGLAAYDSLDKVELENLWKASAVAARLALWIANTEDFPAQRHSAEAVQEIIDTDPGLEEYRISRELAKRRQTS